MTTANVSDTRIDMASHPHEHCLFWSLDDDGDGLVHTGDLERILERNGLTRKDPRLQGMYAALDALDSKPFDFSRFLDITRSASELITKVLRGELALPDFAPLSEELIRQFTEVAKNEAGHQATYIPPLAEVDPNQFGMAVVSVDGQVLELGDSGTDFSVQSATKPFNYCFASNDLGAEAVHRHIGMEPSGQPFNARILLADGTNRPHNPMINAGAIMTTALIHPHKPVHKRLEHVRNMWAKTTGGLAPRFNAWMAQEEGRTGDNNRALGYMMKAVGVLPKGEDASEHELRDALQLYFSVCALELNTRELATAAATLANNGVCPMTRERVFDEGTVRNCLTLMQMCGMYDGSGEFSFHIGLPAKSGVGGAVILVAPSLMGICIWSPRLDAVGNSVRGVDMAKRLVQTYRLHVYDGATEVSERVDPRIPAAQLRARRTSRVLRAAEIGDLHTLQHLSNGSTELSLADYDGRTPLHLAAASGQIAVARFLLESGVAPNARDRWGGTTLHDAQLVRHTEMVNLLQAYGVENGDANHPAYVSSVTEAAAHHGDVDGVVELLWAASEGDLDGLRRCVARGIPVSAADYDGRTALHLAASNGQAETVAYLLAHDHPIYVRDRWNTTPIDDARREHHSAVVELLTAAEKNFHRLAIRTDLQELGKVSAFVKRYTTAYGINPLVSHRISVVLDEALSGVIDHARDDEDCRLIDFAFEVDAEQLQIIVSYQGGEFNVLAPGGSSTDDAELSALGSKLIQKLTKSADYRRESNENILSLAFRLSESIAGA